MPENLDLPPPPQPYKEINLEELRQAGEVLNAPKPSRYSQFSENELRILDKLFRYYEETADEPEGLELIVFQTLYMELFDTLYPDGDEHVDYDPYENEEEYLAANGPRDTAPEEPASPTDKPKARNLVDVIDQMLPLIPKGNGELVKDLDRERSRCFYTAPEAMYLPWQLAMEALRRYFPKADQFEKWHCDVIRVWQGNPELSDEQVKAMC